METCHNCKKQILKGEYANLQRPPYKNNIRVLCDTCNKEVQRTKALIVGRTNDEK